MAIKYREDIAFFEDTCEVEEAEKFVDWLRNTSDPKLDLSKLDHMHTSLLQTILFFKPKIIKFPEDKFWQEILC